MKLQDFRVGLRILAKDPVYSAVSILGLGIGLAVCLLLLSYARYCWQYNSYIPDADNVYIVKLHDNRTGGTLWDDQAPLLLLAAAKTAPGVIGTTAYLGWFPLTTEASGQMSRLGSVTVMPGFAQMIGLKALKGDLDAALSRPDSIAITEAAAIRLFGTAEVVGKILPLHLDAVDENSMTARIAAVVPTPPANTTVPFEVLSGPNLTLIPAVHHEELASGNSEWPGYLLIRLQPGASPEAVKDVLQQAEDAAPSVQKLPPEVKERFRGRHLKDIQLARLRDAYFDNDVQNYYISLQVDRGNAQVVAGLVVVGILMLAIAAINYANLATIRVVRRQREIAMRKVLGASHTRLALQFAAESLIVAMLATAAGFVLAWLGQGVFAELMNRDLGSLLSLANIGTALGLGIILGLITALYPAWVAFGVRPSLMLMGQPDTESPRSKRLRQVLSVLQVSAAIGLASFTLAASWQAQFAMNASPGFDPSALLVFDLPTAVSGHEPKSRGLIAALSQRREITSVAKSNDPIGRSQNPWSTEMKRVGRKPVTMDMKSVSAGFFDQYGIKPVAGRLFDPAQDGATDGAPIVINAIAASQLGFAAPELALGQPLVFKNFQNEAPVLMTRRIIGIAPEIRFYSLREPPGAIAYYLLGDQDGPAWDGTLTVRASGSVEDAERAVREVWPRYFPNSVLQIRPARNIYGANYADDARLAKLLSFATVVAMIIAAFGVYVLAADAVQRRTKEIALRRLFGTRRRNIGGLVTRDIGMILLFSSALALPLAALAIGRYLEVYTERTPLAFWALALAPLAAVAIAALAGARQAWIAMSVKPVIALRS